jgi:pyridoxamine 5'-phosphate oxidase
LTRPVRSRPPLTPDDLGPDPLQAFDRWWREAEAQAGMSYANAMTLATVASEGGPDARVVLLKGIDRRGFLFFTNYESAKGRALDENPRAALSFYWDAMGRQVRVRGRAERLPALESDDYFATRPRGSRLGAWASDQSREISDRESLERRFEELEDRYRGRAVPRPEHWGGYVVRPDQIEFWQDGVDRLHDRFLYRRTGGEWTIVRLSP